jgi:ribosomal protein S12
VIEGESPEGRQARLDAVVARFSLERQARVHAAMERFAGGMCGDVTPLEARKKNGALRKFTRAR